MEMKNVTELIEMKNGNSFIEELMIVCNTKQEAHVLAEDWCKLHDSVLDDIFSKSEQSLNQSDHRTIYYAKVHLN